jgi:hypothetical protein
MVVFDRGERRSATPHRHPVFAASDAGLLIGDPPAGMPGVAGFASAMAAFGAGHAAGATRDFAALTRETGVAPLGLAAPSFTRLAALA